MSVAMFTCGIGMFLFGYTMAIGAPAELCAFLQGVMMFGVLIGIFSTLSYALDAFRSQSNEMFIMNMLFKVCDQGDSQRPMSHWLCMNLSTDVWELFRLLRTSCFTACLALQMTGSPQKGQSKSCSCLAALRSSCVCWLYLCTFMASAYEVGGHDMICS